MSDVDDDAYVLMRWMSELSNPDPDAGLVASLEVIAEDRGWHPYDAWDALRQRNNRPLVAAPFDPDRHPRGHDGRFIELGALLKIVGGENEGKRGDVESITPDPNDPGNPTIRLKMRDGGTVDVKPNEVDQAAEKARLDTPAPAVVEQKKGLFGRKKVREAEAQQQFRQSAGVEVDPETGLTERQEDRNNGEARDEWYEIMKGEWLAKNPGADPQTMPNLYAPAMEEVRARQRGGPTTRP